MSTVTIKNWSPGQNFNSIQRLDIRLRPVQTSQELLRLVPGLFIAQHAGGGKAEQMFLRGFDLDHGTDINISADGIPVNMVSHAHGQGYSDLHFLIPEVVETIEFGKGPYYSSSGNFTTAGYVKFNTAKSVENSIKLEAGSFGTLRNVNKWNILNKQANEKGHFAYVATELLTSKGFFESPQSLKRINLMTKYSGYLNANTILTTSLSHFASKWNASGQIPERAIRQGMITRYGSLDPTEGGKTSRSNFNLDLVNNTSFGTLTNRVYFSTYNFNLFSNFTFFLNDPLNGDQIQQKEQRKIYGYQTSYSREFYVGSLKIESTAGLGIRADKINNINLSHTKSRKFLSPITSGNVSEVNPHAYVESTVHLSDKLKVNGGIRLDHFNFDYSDHLAYQDTLSAVAKRVVSPKLNLNYDIRDNVQVYLKAGMGFHSNDTRVVVAERGKQILPKAYGADLGAILKPAENLVLNAALWMLFLEQELVYIGDEGIIEPSGKSERMGVDLSARLQVTEGLFADMDINYSRARMHGTEGKTFIPLAPSITATGGITIQTKKGWNGFLRCRHIAERPANENYSVTAKGYFLFDATVKYAAGPFEFSLTAENLLNQKWKEAQFDTESRLDGEQGAVSEIHFTPGTPLAVRAGVAFTVR